MVSLLPNLSSSFISCVTYRRVIIISIRNVHCITEYRAALVKVGFLNPLEYDFLNSQTENGLFEDVGTCYLSS